MITDLFFKRYGDQPLLMSQGVPNTFQRFFIQAAQIFFNEVAPALDLDQNFFQRAHDALVRELGTGLLGTGPYREICAGFLTERYDLWKNAHGIPDTFIKLRLSLVELLFRQAEELVRTSSCIVPRGVTLLPRLPGNVAPHHRDIFKKALEELNRRFSEASIPLEYHNGFIQFVQDSLTQQQTTAPFWDLLQDPKWTNVDMDIKEAFDVRYVDGASDSSDPPQPEDDSHEIIQVVVEYVDVPAKAPQGLAGRFAGATYTGGRGPGLATDIGN